MAEKKRLPKRNVDFDEALDDIELKIDNQSVTLTAGKRVEDAISSGSLVYDLIYNNGDLVKINF